jgi:Nif-specific regulatory protein
MLILEVLQGQDKGSRFELNEPVVTLGRSPSCDVTLQDYHLSGEHLQIFFEDEQYVARDLRSTNGSMVLRSTERRVLQGPDRWESNLKDGDRLLLGDPTSPVILSCSVAVSDSDEQTEQVVARKSREELRKLTGKLESAPTDLAALYRASTRITQAGLDLNVVLVCVAEVVFDLLERATHVTILLADKDGERFTPVLARARQAEAGQAVRMSRAVLRRVLTDRAAVLVANAAKELGGTESVMAANIMSSIGVPLWTGEEIRGVLQVDNRTSSGMFRERDLELMAILGSQASSAIASARLYQKLKTSEEKARSEADYLKQHTAKRSFSDIIGTSPAMQKIFSQLEKVIDTRATIHVEGETGTGKELIATAIHYQGSRKDKLFVAANCAALPENLLESELFGHVKGAFTGADREKKGLFEVADGGTLFLDEIAEMSTTLQARLLRVLQEGEIRPVGSSKTKKVDVRIISATNKSLEEEVKAGSFREDLYYRLHVFPIVLPPLRERREDIPLLAQHFLKKYVKELKKNVLGISQEALDLMMAYRWPGNIRELENEVQRLVIQCEADAFIQPDHLSSQIQGPGMTRTIRPSKGTLKERMEQVERWILREALDAHENNKTQTAKTLGITREGLHKKLSKYDM